LHFPSLLLKRTDFVFHYGPIPFQILVSSCLLPPAAATPPSSSSSSKCAAAPLLSICSSVCMQPANSSLCPPSPSQPRQQQQQEEEEEEEEQQQQQQQEEQQHQQQQHQQQQLLQGRWHEGGRNPFPTFYTGTGTLACHTSHVTRHIQTFRPPKCVTAEQRAPAPTASPPSTSA
jgi:hypothetical protein